MTTLKELALLLNLSVSTVSKALNDSHEISDNTKKRVNELAESLNYKPNRIAQQLKQNKTHTLGVIIPTVKNPFFAEVLHGIETEATKHKYDILVCLSDESFSKEKRSVEILSNGSVDGFLMTVSLETQLNNNYKHIESTIDGQIPILLFDRIIEEIDCNKVVVDDYKSVFEATEHLIKNDNRKHIVLLSTIEELNVGKLRISGFENAMAKYHLTPKILKLGKSNNLSQSIKEYLNKNTDIDAVLSIDHITGIVAINTLKNIGKQVPKDVSVIGFGYEHTDELSSPKISMINQKASEIGKVAVELLLEKIANKKSENKKVTVSSDLVLSESSLKKT